MGYACSLVKRYDCQLLISVIHHIQVHPLEPCNYQNLLRPTVIRNHCIHMVELTYYLTHKKVMAMTNLSPNCTCTFRYIRLSPRHEIIKLLVFSYWYFFLDT